jgi:hypothetical protein
MIPLDSRLRVPAQAAADRSRPGWFLLSAAVHGSLLGFVALGSRPAAPVRRPVYESLIRPNEKRIIWYRKPPDIAPAARISDEKDPQGEVKSNTTKIALSTQPRSSRQLILHSAPQIKIEQDLQAPDLVAIAAPPPPKPRKVFVAPPAAAPPRPPDPVLQEPELQLTWTDPSGAERSLSLLRQRRFIPPPARERPKLPTPVMLDAPVDTALGTTAPPAGLPGLATSSKPPPKSFTPPSGRKSSGSGSGAGGVSLEAPPSLQAGASVDAAIVGLNPADHLSGPIPPGSRPGQFSAAPTVGKTATGEVNGAGGIVVPGLMIKEGKREPVNPVAPPLPAVAGSRILLYDDMIPIALRPTLSAPLRPASRTIPRALEARFQGRVVYAVVIPAPNLPAYTGDWIMWFAARAQISGESLMRAPIPLRKIEPADKFQTPSGDRSEARIQLAAVIRSDGRFDGLAPVRGSAAAFAGAIEDMARWEFRPATSGGSPIEVEVVIEIPFNVAWLSRSP